MPKEIYKLLLTFDLIKLYLVFRAAFYLRCAAFFQLLPNQNRELLRIFRKDVSYDSNINQP
jgi:hypothetical protein